ncbi:hypothetical protein Pmani_018111 [Petrolisthes manimaculis]|uniref:Uncharacterized protein n=1 Tax=Petrolisthes manimaculis TaxID=1843537 RepID=A0AAE1U550_9EUCA|nr:hypothetical protein Pmani_018111 [Petrolisthes manimaculis]
MGLVVKKEVDFAVGPFVLNLARAEAVDYTPYLVGANRRIVSRRGRPEADPWGFLLPLSPVVWLAMLGSFLGILMATIGLSFFSLSFSVWRNWMTDGLTLIRIILQQDILTYDKWWWWEHILMGMWMLTTLVLTRSYSGNLMSLLAVRHVRQPYQTLRDVLDDTNIIQIWQKNSAGEQLLRDSDIQY